MLIVGSYSLIAGFNFQSDQTIYLGDLYTGSSINNALYCYRQMGGSSGRLTPGGGSRNQSRESSATRAPAVVQQLTPEKLERKIKAIIDEYLQTHDLTVRLN